MTDEEIEKALEHCGTTYCKCAECKYNSDAKQCQPVLMLDALDYINRLKDEIVGLTGKVEALEADKSNLERTLDEANEEIAGLKAENKSLKDYIKQCESGNAYWVNCLIERPKEVAKEILDEVNKHFGGAWLVELYKKYGIEVDE